LELGNLDQLYGAKKKNYHATSLEILQLSGWRCC
jgi:hypothetical protein